MKWLVLNVRTVRTHSYNLLLFFFFSPTDSTQNSENDEKEKSMPQMEFYSCNDMAYACHTTISYGCRRRQ